MEILVAIKFVRNVWSEDFVNKLMFETKVALRQSAVNLKCNDVVFGLCHFLYQNSENCLAAMFMAFL